MSIWDNWDDSDLKAMFRSWLSEGLSASQMAQQLGHGISRNAVIGKVHRLGLAMNTSNKGGVPWLVGKPKPRTAYNFAAAHINARTETPRKAMPIVPEGTDSIDMASDDDIPVPQRKTFAELEPVHCKWPIGDPLTPHFHYCGGKRIIGGPYCEHHMARAYQPPEVKSRNGAGKKRTEKKPEFEMA